MAFFCGNSPFLYLALFLFFTFGADKLVIFEINNGSLREIRENKYLLDQCPRRRNGTILRINHIRSCCSHQGFGKYSTTLEHLLQVLHLQLQQHKCHQLLIKPSKIHSLDVKAADPHYPRVIQHQ